MSQPFALELAHPLVSAPLWHGSRVFCVTTVVFCNRFLPVGLAEPASLRALAGRTVASRVWHARCYVCEAKALRRGVGWQPTQARCEMKRYRIMIGWLCGSLGLWVCACGDVIEAPPIPQETAYPSQPSGEEPAVVPPSPNVPDTQSGVPEGEESTPDELHPDPNPGGELEAKPPATSTTNNTNPSPQGGACGDVSGLGACVECACNHCETEVSACYADPGCVSVVECALRTACAGLDCLTTCESEIEAAGGVLAPAVMQAVALSECRDRSCASEC